MLPFDLDPIKSTLKRYHFPVDVIVETNASCNLKCILCPQPTLKRQKGEMKFDIFKKIVDEIVAKSPATRLWMALMGEPLLMGDRLVTMIKYARDRGIHSVHLNTNAVFLSYELSDKLIAAGLDEIIISLDAHTRSTYDKIRIGGDFHRVIDNVNYLLNRRKELGRDNPIVYAQFIVMDQNAHEIEDFKKYWLQKGAVAKVRRQLGWGTGVEAPHLTLPDSERTFPCPWITRAVGIQWNGRFVQCDGDYEGVYSPGDINVQTIEEVWSGELAKRREKHWALDFSHDLCSKCKDWQACRSQFYYPTGR